MFTRVYMNNQSNLSFKLSSQGFISPYHNPEISEMFVYARQHHTTVVSCVSIFRFRI